MGTYNKSLEEFRKLLRFLLDTYYPTWATLEDTTFTQPSQYTLKRWAGTVRDMVLPGRKLFEFFLAEYGKKFHEEDIFLLRRLLAEARSFYRESSNEIIDEQKDQPTLTHWFSHPYRNQFDTYIADKISGFVGRKYVFESIKSFVHNPYIESGYFIIEADPGVGKSSILAKYAQDTGCIAYFNIRQQGNNKIQKLLESICVQIVHRYSLPYIPLPSTATEDGMFLAVLLEEATRKRPYEKLTIIVDALDEIEEEKLPLPMSLPRGVYFIMSKRRKPISMPPTAAIETCNLMQHSKENLQDAITYINQQIANSTALRDWILKKDIRDSQFAEELAHKSEANFMYLYHILRDIANNKYPDFKIDRFPPGLIPYYQDHWERMRVENYHQYKILYVLAIAAQYQPLRVSEISSIVQENHHTVVEVLRAWQQFLHLDDRRFDGTVIPYEQREVSLYHASFEEFLMEKDTIASIGLDLHEIHDMIIQRLVNLDEGNAG